MQEAFGYVLFGVVIVGAIIALITFAGTAETYKQIGRGGLSLNEDDDGRIKDRPVAPAASAAEREAEIRQLLEARNVRRERRGQAPLDVEAEMARLERPGIDPALEAEIRELVVARNARRIARGREPLDVEAEVARQLRELA